MVSRWGVAAPCPTRESWGGDPAVDLRDRQRLVLCQPAQRLSHLQPPATWRVVRTPPRPDTAACFAIAAATGPGGRRWALAQWRRCRRQRCKLAWKAERRYSRGGAGSRDNDFRVGRHHPSARLAAASAALEQHLVGGQQRETSAVAASKESSSEAVSACSCSRSKATRSNNPPRRVRHWGRSHCCRALGRRDGSRRSASTPQQLPLKSSITLRAMPVSVEQLTRGRGVGPVLLQLPDGLSPALPEPYRASPPIRYCSRNRRARVAPSSSAAASRRW